MTAPTRSTLDSSSEKQPAEITAAISALNPPVITDDRPFRLEHRAEQSVDVERSNRTQVEITNPFPDAYTSGEPEAIALKDQSSSDAVDILNNQIVEGNSDPGSGTDFPIGIDTFLNSAPTVITGNTVSGFFQGALLEDNGPAKVSKNTFSGEIANSVGSTVYPGEGVFFLSDEAGSLTGQDAISNTFSGYSGYGVAMDAGYANGNCSLTPCNGSISGVINKNHFALTAGSPGAAAISLSSQNNGNVLTVSVNQDSGYVTAPSIGVSVSATGGGDASGARPYRPDTSLDALAHGRAPRQCSVLPRARGRSA